MTKVLILGVTGMLGHKLYQVLGQRFDVTGTIRGEYADVSGYGFFEADRVVPGVNAMDARLMERAIDDTAPDVVVNCIGVVKSLVESAGSLVTVQLNALLPHQLYQMCRERGIRLIHLSTDCVFSGKKGDYREDDPSDAEDFYGKSKYLGEAAGPGALTIRTSIIGRELSGANGLVEWFLGNRGGTVRGFSNAVFSGFPTLHLAGIIGDIISNHQELESIYHVAAEPIDKYRLLELIKKETGLDIEITPYPDYRIDRSLDATRYRAATGFEPLPWERMVAEMTADAVPYAQWRHDDISR